MPPRRGREHDVVDGRPEAALIRLQVAQRPRARREVPKRRDGRVERGDRVRAGAACRHRRARAEPCLTDVLATPSARSGERRDPAGSRTSSKSPRSWSSTPPARRLTAAGVGAGPPAVRRGRLGRRASGRAAGRRARPRRCRRPCSDAPCRRRRCGRRRARRRSRAARAGGSGRAGMDMHSSTTSPSVAEVAGTMWRPASKPGRRSRAERSGPADGREPLAEARGRARAGRRCGRTARRTMGAAGSAGGLNEAAQPTCMWAVGLSTARNEASSGESRVVAIATPRVFFRFDRYGPANCRVSSTRLVPALRAVFARPQRLRNTISTGIRKVVGTGAKSPQIAE